MDFKSLINKLDSMEAPPKAIAAPELPKSVQLNEDAQLRVLSGRTTYVAEAKKMKEADDMKVGDSKKTSTGGTVTKTKTGIVHKAGNNYSGKAAEKEDKKKTDESIKEASDKKAAAQEKFKAMIAKKKGEKKEVKEAAKPDFLDMDKDGDKKEPMKKAVADKKKNPFGKKDVKEASDDDADFDNISHGVSSPEEKKKQEKSMIDTFKKSGKKANPDSQIGRLMKKHGVSLESKMMPKGKKRPVKESFEPKLTFKQMVKLVQESGGQQQIDAVDKELFAWAKRVASTKFNEGTKAEIYAGLVYERRGGVFEMYDVLSESKKINEGRVQLDEGIFDKIKSVIMSKILPKLSSDEKSEMANAVKSALGTDQVSMKDLTMDNVKAVAKALGAKPKTDNAGIGEDEDSYFDKSATLGEKLANIGGIIGGFGSLVAAFGFSGPGWLIIPGIIGIMFMSQIGMSKKGSY